MNKEMRTTWIGILLPGAMALGGLALQDYPLARISAASTTVFGLYFISSEIKERKVTSLFGSPIATTTVGMAVALLPAALEGAKTSTSAWVKTGYQINAMLGMTSSIFTLCIVYDHVWHNPNLDLALEHLTNIFLPVVACGLHRLCSPSSALIGVGIAASTAFLLEQTTSNKTARSPAVGMALFGLMASFVGFIQEGGAPYIAAIILNGLAPIDAVTVFIFKPTQKEGAL